MPAPRSRTTCYQCRTRKVRCQGWPNGCTACKRLGYRCSFESTSLTSDPTPTQLERRRGERACNECRAQKIKCSGESPTCAGCRRRGRDCEYPEAKRRRSQTQTKQSLGTVAVHDDSDKADVYIVSDSTVSSSAAESSLVNLKQPRRNYHSDPRAQALPPTDTQIQLVDDFFNHLYPLPLYSFLHERSIRQRCQEGSLDESLILSICAISATRLHRAAFHPDSTSVWVQRAENLVWSHLEHPTIFRTQALLLICQYHIETGGFQKAFMLSSIVSRAASALRLQYERTDIHPLAQEIRRRLMWCLILLDGHFSNGLPECELCPFENVYLKLPCSEEELTLLHNPETNEDSPSLSLGSDPEDGLLSTIIRAATIRRDMSRLKRQMWLSGTPLPQLEALAKSFSHGLQALKVEPYCKATLRKHSTSRWLLRYVVSHLSSHQGHCDLHRLFLSGYSEAASDIVLSAVSHEFMATAATECFQHAPSILEILHDFNELRLDMRVPDVDIAICSYHATRILLFLGKSNLNPYSSGLDPDTALNKAKSTFNVIHSLFKGSTIARFILDDLGCAIAAYQPSTPGNGYIPPLDSGKTSPHRPKFAIMAKKHQNLAVHSILRQARFVDDSSAAVSSSNEAAKQTQHAMAHRCRSVEVPVSNTTSSQSLSLVEASTSDLMSGATEWNENAPMVENLVVASDTRFWSDWNETWGLDEWPMEADEHYF